MRRTMQILIAILLFSGLSACKSVETMPENMIRVAIASYPVSLDPTVGVDATSNLVNAQIYETLFSKSDSTYTPVLAQALPVCEANGLTCVFKTTPAYFHNGNLFEAKDAVYSINHLVAAKATTMSDAIKAATLIDASTFSITLNYPDGELMSKLSNPMFAMIPIDSDVDGKLASLPIGTGPYKFVSQDKKSSVKLTRYDNYRATAALIPDLEFVVYADINRALTALRDKQVNLVTDVPVDAETKLSGLKDIQWLTLETAATVYLGIRSQSMMNKELESSAFRKGLLSSIDRSILAGYFSTTVVTNLYGKGVFGNSERTVAFPSGVSIEKFKDMEISLVAPKALAGFDIAGTLAQQLSAKGFTKVKVEALAQDEYLRRTSADKGFDLMLFVWKYELADGGDFIDSFFGVDSVNRLRYRNSDLDALILAVDNSVDMQLRKDNLIKIEDILVKEGLILPLTKISTRIAADKALSNLQTNSGYILNIAEIAIAK
jgi:peptide/nickel transport system substrate-binding protein